jgi:nucleotide-binding universal stress UspA family protein
MIERILLAVDDTLGSVAAARVAIELARALRAQLRVVHVDTDHALARIVEATGGRPRADARRTEAGAAVLARFTAVAAESGVDAQAQMLSGDVAAVILDHARTWPADLIVLGRPARSASGEPYIGTLSRHILEFAERPVLLVPMGVAPSPPG